VKAFAHLRDCDEGAFIGSGSQPRTCAAFLFLLSIMIENADVLKIRR
jgi:hypothetical protein